MTRPVENLIYDRTEHDVVEGTSKGYHNASDLNRIESWAKYLAEELIALGYNTQIISKTDWAITDTRVESEMERIRTNINKLKTAYFSFYNIPATINYIDIDKANQIEKILNDIDFLIGKMTINFNYSDEIYLGE